MWGHKVRCETASIPLRSAFDKQVGGCLTELRSGCVQLELGSQQCMGGLRESVRVGNAVKQGVARSELDYVLPLCSVLLFMASYSGCVRQLLSKYKSKWVDSCWKPTGWRFEL